MESLSLQLQPYKQVVETFASVVTILQIFSGVFVCFEFRARQSSSGFSVAPFLGGTVFSILNLEYGRMLKDSAMINVNLIGLALSIVYTTVFVIYTPTHEKGPLFQKFATASGNYYNIISPCYVFTTVFYLQPLLLEL
jgi:solute carrier family 50 (sugar transporter)